MDGTQIDNYRQPWESDEHWTLRKEFIERFLDDFPEDRLLCLAQVYSNVELLGCSYPAPVMRQMRELSKKLDKCTELREKRKERAAVQFVKEKQKTPKNSWNNSGTFSQKRSSSESHTQANNLASSGTSSKKLKPSDSKSPSDSSAEICSDPLKGGKNSDFNMNEQSSSSKNSCQRSAFGGGGVNTEQKSSKSITQKTDTATSETSYETVLQMDTLPKCLKDNLVDVLRFIRISLTKSLTPLEILNNMIQKFHIKVEYNIKFLPRIPPIQECSLKIDDVFISKAEGPTKKRACNEAARIAIDLLMSPSTKNRILSSCNINKPSIASDSKILCEEKCVKRFADPSPNSMNKMTTCGNGRSCNNMFDSTLDVTRNTSLLLNTNTQNSVLYKDAHRGHNLLFNQRNHSVPLNQIVTSSVYQNSGSMPIPKSHDSTTRQNVSCVSPAKRPNQTGYKNSCGSDSSPEFLVILDNSDITKSDTAASLFTSSANFNHVPFQFEYESCSAGTQLVVKAQIIMNGGIFSSAVGENKLIAKDAAAKAAIDILRKTAYTIKVKDEHDGGFTVTRNQVFDTAESKSSITESNIGCKMLKMMGWSGGGIGKAGNQGIEEPVKAVEKHKFGQGLGYTNKGNSEVSFTARIEQILQDYAKSNSTSDLIFSTEFSKEERKEIHRVACKYGLKNNSKGGKGDGRHLIVSRRYTAQQLIKRLKQSGGRTHKYELIPPTG